MSPKRLSIKFNAKNPEVIDSHAFVAVFQRWIQNHTVEGLLIDVADYKHVPNGPGVLLIAHEGDYSYTESTGQAGLQYISKQPLADTLESSIATVLRLALDAALKLEKETSLNGLSFDFSTAKIVFQDRLNYPNNAETFAAIQPALIKLFEQITGETLAISNASPEDSREAFALSLLLPVSVTGEVLLSKLAVAE